MNFFFEISIELLENRYISYEIYLKGVLFGTRETDFKNIIYRYNLYLLVYIA